MSPRSNAWFVIGTLILLASRPVAANAQFGTLKKLKNSISPDSSAKVEAAREDGQQGGAARMRNSPPPRSAGQGMPGKAWGGFTEANARAIAAFQQEMMQVAMAASSGDVAARGRLERWQAIAVKYQPEIEKLSLAASGGDMASVHRLQVIQIDIIKEWANTGTVKAVKPVKATKAVAKPVNATTP